MFSKDCKDMPIAKRKNHTALELASGQQATWRAVSSL